MITAKRGQETRSFNEKVWAEMPAHKYGWIPATEAPEEVAALMAQNTTGSQNNQPEPEPNAGQTEAPEEVAVQAADKTESTNRRSKKG